MGSFVHNFSTFELAGARDSPDEWIPIPIYFLVHGGRFGYRDVEGGFGITAAIGGYPLESFTNHNR